jgi:(S)-mandelate dehydrogenase
MSNDDMAQVARVRGLRYWWQLYVFGPPEVHERLIERARNAGYEALIVTVDAQIHGNQEWYKRTTSSPKSLNWSSRFDALMHPRWLAGGILSPPGLERLPSGVGSLSAGTDTEPTEIKSLDQR